MSSIPREKDTKGQQSPLDRNQEIRLRELEKERDQLEARNTALLDEVAELRGSLNQAQRARKRQAAPFSKGPPKSEPRRPGRKAGSEYGTKAYRRNPARVDDIVDAWLPDACPECNEAVEEVDVKHQYQEDIPPVEPWVTRFNVHIGRCLGCQKRVQGRHPRQTSNALGAAAAHLGPRALALAAVLNKKLGLSFAKVSSLFLTLFSLSVTRGGLCLALHRLAKAAKPSYEALVQSVRTSAVVAPDETGWRMNGQSWWLWVFVGDSTTVYAILPGRGFDEAASILGADYSGILERDGWAPYRKFLQAKHQSCLNHLKIRCHRLLQAAKRGAARVPHAVKRILDRAFELRDRRQQYSSHGWAVVLGQLSANLKRLLLWKPKDDENRRLLKHLNNEQDALFTFLRETGVQATNWRAEQAIRPAVVTRKLSAGNRTPEGAMTQQIIASVLRTCDQQGLDVFALVEDILSSDRPRVARVLQASAASSAQGP